MDGHSDYNINCIQQLLLTSALFINDVLVSDDKAEGAAVPLEAAVRSIILGGVVIVVGVKVLLTNRFDALLGGVPKWDGAGVVISAELGRLVGDDGVTFLERETDRLLRRSARDDIAVVMLVVSMDTTGIGTEFIASFICPSDDCVI